ncbi:hypothetical protein [Flagellimonas marinaquae]|uniref:hypothetical protein n=1 Tax=Flagellimonas TaxID=444459 RepID=UPI000F8F2640|nr:hypothetical protein [Allomuricauda aquimarina]
MTAAERTKGNAFYWILILLALVVGIIFYGGFVDDFSLKFLLFFSGVPFLLFVSGAFGLLWPKLKPSGEESYIIHSLVLGLLFFILFLLHVWVILPIICPEFRECLAM